jgi:hypothetical protein
MFLNSLFENFVDIIFFFLLQKKPDWSKKGEEKKVGEKEVEA